MMKKIFFLFQSVLLLSVSIAQNVGINNANLTPDPSAGLDVNYTDKGVLIPRVALTGTTDVTTIPGAATSLLVYNTATAGSGSTAVTPGYYYWDGSQWLRLLNTGNAGGMEWLLTGNAGTSAGTNFIGTTDAQDLVFKTNNTENMRIDNTTGNVGIGTASPNSNALLHLQSTDKGVLLPQVALIAANNPAPVTAPTTGLLVYNTATSGIGNTAVTPGYYYWDGTRWQKFQTNAYAGMIQGYLFPSSGSGSFVLNIAPPNWQYTGSYIDLPPGQWIVYFTMLVAPMSSPLPNNASSWIRSSLSESSATFSYSGDIVGSALVSGLIVGPAPYSLVTGQIIINNTSGTTKRYHYWANNQDLNYSAGFNNFGQSYWGENQFFALPAN